MATQVSQSRPRVFPQVNMSYSLQEGKVWSFYPFSARGSLDISRGHITFNGQSQTVHIRDIHDIRMVRADFRWKDYILVILFLASIFFAVSFASLYFAISDVVNFLYYIILMVMSGIIVYSAFAVLFHIFDVWLMVVYLDEHGARKRIYFSQWGQLGVFSNKTKFLFDEVVLKRSPLVR